MKTSEQTNAGVTPWSSYDQNDVNYYRHAIVAVDNENRLEQLWTTNRAGGVVCWSFHNQWTAIHAVRSALRIVAGEGRQLNMILQPRDPLLPYKFAENLTNDGVPRAAALRAMSPEERHELVLRLASSEAERTER